MNTAYPTTVTTLGDHIRKIRLDKGLLQKDVSKIIGVDEMTITNWENNRSEPMSGYYPSLVFFMGYIPEILEENRVLGQRLKAYRKEYKLTQKQLANNIGIGLNTLRGIENNGGKILGKTKEAIQEFLNFKVEKQFK